MSDANPIVVLTRALPDAWLGELRGRTELVIGDADTAGFDPHLLEALPQAEGILSLLTERVDTEILDRAPRLRVVSNMAVGVDNIDIDACVRRGIAVGHTPGVLTDATADLTMALLLAATRRLVEANADARAGAWTTWSPTGWLGADLQGATLGIVGMGKIGRAVAHRARAFGLRILYATRTPRPSDPSEGTAVSLPRLLEQADIVSLHAPLTEQTRGLINAAALGRMKPSAYLINTARGDLVDAVALRDALESGRLRGAALDVTTPEPLPPNDQLWSTRGLTIVPHIGSATSGVRHKMAEIAVDNVLAGVHGRALRHRFA